MDLLGGSVASPEVYIGLMVPSIIDILHICTKNKDPFKRAKLYQATEGWAMSNIHKFTV